MTTDTKAVARWDVLGHDDMEQTDDGPYVAFTDHEQVVADLTKAHQDNLDSWLHQREEIAFLRAELAAKSKDAARYAWLRNPDIDVGLVIDKVTGEIPYDEGNRTGGYNTYEYRAGEELDAAIDAAIKKGEGNGR